MEYTGIHQHHSVCLTQSMYYANFHVEFTITSSYVPLSFFLENKKRKKASGETFPLGEFWQICQVV